MNPRSRRSYLRTVGTLGVGLGLAGCSGGDENQSSSPTDSSPDNSENEQTSDDSGADDSVADVAAGPSGGDPQGVVNPEIQWQQRFGEEPDAFGPDVIDATYAHSDGFVVSGTAPVRADGEWQSMGAVRCLTADGNVDWRYDYEDDEVVNSVFRSIAAVSNGYLAVGHRFTDLSEKATGLLVKLDREGRKQWERKYVEQQFEGQSNRAVTYYDGGYVVSGTSAESLSMDGHARRLGPGGERQWSWTTDTDTVEVFYSHTSGTEGEILLVGESEQPDADAERQPRAVALTGDGSVARDQTYAVPDDQNMGGIVDAVTLPDGYLYLVNVTGEQGRYPVLVRVDESGQVMWQESYPADVWVVGRSVAAASPDRFYMTAAVVRRTEDNDNRTNVRVVETDGNGTQQWAAEYGDMSSSISVRSLLLRDDGFILAGDEHIEPDGYAMWASRLA